MVTQYCSLTIVLSEFHNETYSHTWNLHQCAVSDDLWRELVDYESLKINNLPVLIVVFVRWWWNECNHCFHVMSFFMHLHIHIFCHNHVLAKTVTFCLPVIVICYEMCTSPYIHSLSCAVSYVLCSVMIYYHQI